MIISILQTDSCVVTVQSFPDTFSTRSIRPHCFLPAYWLYKHFYLIDLERYAVANGFSFGNQQSLPEAFITRSIWPHCFLIWTVCATWCGKGSNKVHWRAVISPMVVRVGCACFNTRITFKEQSGNLIWSEGQRTAKITKKGERFIIELAIHFSSEKISTGVDRGYFHTW